VIEALAAAIHFVLAPMVGTAAMALACVGFWVWAFGCVLDEMVTARRAFEGPTPAAVTCTAPTSLIASSVSRSTP